MLFDMSFTEFVTTRIIRVIFIIAIVLAVFSTIAVIGAAFSTGTGWGVLALLLSPLIFLLYVLAARVWCEIIIVVFRIAENTGRLVALNDHGDQHPHQHD